MRDRKSINVRKVCASWSNEMCSHDWSPQLMNCHLVHQIGLKNLVFFFPWNSQAYVDGCERNLGCLVCFIFWRFRAPFFILSGLKAWQLVVAPLTFCRVAESWACSVWPWNQGPRFSFFLCVCGSLFCCRVSYLWGTFIEASSGSYIHPGECGCYKLLMLYDSWWESETQNLEWWFLSIFLSKLTILVILGLGPRSTYNSNDERMCALCF